jgi:cell wall-associated NlpC family hydrolase
MSEVEQRAAVIAAARSWIGTPYHHAADIKGAGVDCAMILVRIFCDLGLVEPFDPRPYTQDWFLHRDEQRYVGFLLARAHAVDPSTGSKPQPGDIVLFKLGRCFAHGGVITKPEPLIIVHAFAPARRVIEDEVWRMPQMMARERQFFSMWDA